MQDTQTGQQWLIEKFKKSLSHRQYLSIAGMLLIFIGVVIFCLTQSENTPVTLTINRAKFCPSIPNSTSSSPLSALHELGNDIFSVSGDVTTLRIPTHSVIPELDVSPPPEGSGDVFTVKNDYIHDYKTEYIDDYIGES